MESKRAVQALAGLAQETRLAVFRLLVESGPQGMTPGTLAEALGVPAPTLSFHLKELAQAGWVKSRQEGRHVWYAPDFALMNELLAYLTANCCARSPAGADDCC